MTVYRSLEHFYEARGGLISGETDFGVWWRDGTAPGHGPFFRISAVHDTGDVYAKNQWTGQVDLGTVPTDPDCLGNKPAEEPGRINRHSSSCAYEVAEHLLTGWTDHHDVGWVRERLLAFRRHRGPAQLIRVDGEVGDRVLVEERDDPPSMTAWQRDLENERMAGDF